MKHLFFAILFLMGSRAAVGQSQEFFTGVFPEMSLTRKLANQNNLNFKIENQHVLFNNSPGESDRIQFVHYRTDIMSFYDVKIAPTKSIALGLFHRFQDGADGNRILQQFAFLQRLRNFRIGHRLRTDQTFTSGEGIELRVRYRAALDIPLDGSNLDPGEGYLVISNEPIVSFKENQLEIENRLIFTYGKLLNMGSKLEWSIDYRTDGFIQEGFRTRLWAKIGFFQNF